MGHQHSAQLIDEVDEGRLRRRAEQLEQKAGCDKDVYGANDESDYYGRCAKVVSRISRTSEVGARKRVRRVSTKGSQLRVQDRTGAISIGCYWA
jgi:hypothetical protein